VESAGDTKFTFVIETPDGTIPRMQVSIPEKPIGMADLVPLMFDWYENNKEVRTRSWPAGMLMKKLLEITVEPGTVKRNRKSSA